MSNRNLFILTVIAVAMLAWAIVVSNLSDQRSTRPSTPTYLIQGLDPSLIAKIDISEGDKHVTLQRNSDQFVIPDKDDYPASIKEINGLINTIMDIKTDSLQTDNPSNHVELEVTPETASKTIEFRDAQGKTLAGLIIGKTTEEPRKTYIRAEGSDAVYSSTNVPYIRTGATDYINKKLCEVPREKIQKVSVSGPDTNYTLVRDGDNVKLDPLPDGKQAKKFEPKRVLETLAALDCADVKKDVPGLELNYKYICMLNDSTIYTLKLGKKDDKTYATLSCQFTNQTQVTINPNQQDSEEELKKKEAILTARDNAETFDQLHKGWVYEIASWQASNLIKPLTDLIEDIPAEPAAAETPAANPVDAIKDIDSMAAALDPNAH